MPQPNEFTEKTKNGHTFAQPYYEPTMQRISIFFLLTCYSNILFFFQFDKNTKSMWARLDVGLSISICFESLICFANLLSQILVLKNQ